MNSYAVTHIGYVKRKNEDRYIVKNCEKGKLFVVADGVGGNIAGHHAAKTIVETLSLIDENVYDIGKELKELIEKSHELVIAKIDKHHKLEGMGSTATSLYVTNKSAYWSHVGDSRLYIMNDSEIKQITKDHTMAQFLLDEGAITIDDESYEQSKNFLIQCVGGSECEPDFGNFDVKEGDILLLASDGLHDFIEDELIHKIMIETDALETGAGTLLDEALKTGGKDNITIAVAKI